MTAVGSDARSVRPWWLLLSFWVSCRVVVGLVATERLLRTGEPSIIVAIHLSSPSFCHNSTHPISLQLVLEAITVTVHRA